ncbi:MAG TPA: hypothetical protein VE377_02540 [Candidatus Dormibacteraeota bacterium]|nr:hypothetical protein [Candidatus Dormibacteraeota bacterium]
MKGAKWIAIWPTAMVCLGITACTRTPPCKLEETRLGPVDEQRIDTVISPDGKRIAYVALRDGKLLVVVDGREGPEYDAIDKGTPVFSSDGKRVAYTAQKGGKWLVVVDGQEGAA